MQDGLAFNFTAEAGEVIFREGDSADCAYLIESGAVETSVMRDGQCVTLNRLGPGDVFGEMAMIDNNPRSATAIARDRSRLLLIRREQLDRRVAESDPVLRMCMSVLVARLRAATAQVGAPAPTPANDDCTSAWIPCDSDTDKQRAQKLLLLEQELLAAIRQNAFEPHFQPIVEMETGRTIGYEALARWRHPERGLISPGVFIPAAEASGMVVEIDRLVRRRAFAAIAARTGVPGTARLFVSVNVSAREFQDTRFVDEIRAAIAETGIDPALVKLELTETCLIGDTDAAQRKIYALKTLGLTVAVDDFGTGYSSLSYLGRLPIDLVKVDRSFVTRLDCPRHASIVDSILQLAASLGATVVAEGVETDAQREHLAKLGVRYAQGFLFGRPQPLPRAQEAAD